MTESIWSVDLNAGARPVILGTTDKHVLISPGHDSDLVEMRSLADYGRIERSFTTRRMAGNTAVPMRARLLGDRVYVLTGMSVGSNRVNMLMNMQSYFRSPSLQVFDVATGKLKWAADLAKFGAGSSQTVMPIEVCRTHVGILVKQNYTQPAYAMLFDAHSGRNVQEVALPGMQPQRGGQSYIHMKYYWLGSPVFASGRFLLETPKAIQFYGRKTGQ